MFGFRWYSRIYIVTIFCFLNRHGFTFSSTLEYLIDNDSSRVSVKYKPLSLFTIDGKFIKEQNYLLRLIFEKFLLDLFPTRHMIMLKVEVSYAEHLYITLDSLLQ